MALTHSGRLTQVFYVVVGNRIRLTLKWQATRAINNDPIISRNGPTLAATLDLHAAVSLHARVSTHSVDPQSQPTHRIE